MHPNRTFASCPFHDGAALYVDWKASDFDARPQKLVAYCCEPGCLFRELVTACDDGEDEGMFWHGGRARCRVCSHEAHVVFPAGTDEDNLECASCGHMTAEVVDESDNEDDAGDEAADAVG